MNEFSEEDIQKEIESVKASRTRGADAVNVMNEFTEDRIRELYEFISRYDAIKDAVL